MGYDNRTGITASAETLMRQGAHTADYYLSRAIEDIDARLGKGYSAKNPELIAAYMRVAGDDCCTAIEVQSYGDALYRLGEEVESLAGAVKSVADAIPSFPEPQ